MDFREYQRRALETDRTAANYENAPQRDVVVALLGIAGELGTLAATYKKYLRDGSAYKLHAPDLAVEIGDLLWYAAVLANKFDLNLADIAAANLQKTSNRWGEITTPAPRYDEDFDVEQSVPRKFEIEFREVEIGGRIKAVMYLDGKQLGNSLTDNADVDDDYRFHDAFHLAFLAVLGWSPVLRKLMGKKRRTSQRHDENEDGGRAIVIDEGISALVFEYGHDHGQLAGAGSVDFELIKTIKAMTRRLEVKDQSEKAWEDAIRAGWKVFRFLTERRGGIVRCDLDRRRIECG